MYFLHLIFISHYCNLFAKHSTFKWGLLKFYLLELFPSNLGFQPRSGNQQIFLLFTIHCLLAIQFFVQIQIKQSYVYKEVLPFYIV